MLRDDSEESLSKFSTWDSLDDKVPSKELGFLSRENTGGILNLAEAFFDCDVARGLRGLGELISIGILKADPSSESEKLLGLLLLVLRLSLLFLELALELRRGFSGVATERALELGALEKDPPEE